MEDSNSISESAASFTPIKRQYSPSDEDKPLKKQKLLDSYLNAEEENVNNVKTNDKECNQVITIHETYEIAFQNDHPNETEIFIFDFFDSVNISYPVESEDIDYYMNVDMPLLLKPAHNQRLQAIATVSIKKLTRSINTWLKNCKDLHARKWKRSFIDSYNTMSLLRRQVYSIITSLVPNMKIAESFDCTSPDLDKILFKITNQLADDNRSEEIVNFHDNSPPDAVFFTAVNSDPDNSLRVLQKRIVFFLCMILPDLKIPEHFDLDKDLPALLDAVHAYNSL